MRSSHLQTHIEYDHYSLTCSPFYVLIYQTLPLNQTRPRLQFYLAQAKEITTTMKSYFHLSLFHFGREP